MNSDLPDTFEPLTLFIFAAVTIICLVVDLVGHRKDQEVTFNSACIWSVFWIFISVCFGIFLYYHFDENVASLFFSGYILEKSLSVDNLFAIMAIFAWFRIPRHLHHRILYFGILGAIFFRAVFVGVGTFLLTFGVWVEIIFGLFVLYSAYVMAKESNRDENEIVDYSTHRAYRFTRSLFPQWPKLEGHNFFVGKERIRQLLELPENRNIVLRRKGLVYATPLFLCMGVVEIGDISFSFDSVPAVIAVSKEPMIIYSAMIFAILGLRSLYFVLEALTRILCHLAKAVIGLLIFIGFKLIYNSICDMFGLKDYEITTSFSMVVIILALGLGIATSLIFREKTEQTEKENS